MATVEVIGAVVAGEAAAADGVEVVVAGAAVAVALAAVAPQAAGNMRKIP